MSDVIVNVKANTSSAKAALGQFKSSLNDTISGLTGFNLNTLAGAGAVVAIGNAVKDAVTGWVDYNHEMDKGAMATGMQVTEFSRLVQAGDDVRVSQDAITTALALATKNGFQPSIESLAQLADRMQGISDPTQRAAELSQLFGKGWREIYPLLENGGQALRDATAAQADGMLVTEESIKAGDELYGIWDSLGDSSTALANTLATELTPALKAMGEGVITAIGTIGLLVTWQRRLDAALAEHNKEIVLTTDGYRQYVDLYIQAALASGKMTQATYDNIVAGREMMPLSQQFLQNLGMTSAFEYEAARASAKMTESSQAMVPVLQEQVDISSDAANEMRNIWLQANGATEQNLRFGGAINELRGATENLQSVQSAWAKGAGQDVKTQLEAAGIKGDAYTKALAAIDSQMGTNFAQEQAYKDNIKALVDQYKRTGDIQGFTDGIGSLRDKFQELDEKVTTARVRVEELKAALDLLVSRTYTVNVVTNTINNGGGGSSSTPDTSTDTSDSSDLITPHRAAGGPVTGNRPYYVGERGTELFVPSSSGSIVPNNRLSGPVSITIIVNGAGSPKATANAIALRLAGYGKQYQGG